MSKTVLSDNDRECFGQGLANVAWAYAVLGFRSLAPRIRPMLPAIPNLQLFIHVLYTLVHGHERVT